MIVPTARRPSSILAALAICIGLQMTAFAMVLPLFARRSENFGAGVQALGVSDMAYGSPGRSSGRSSWSTRTMTLVGPSRN